VTLKKEPLTRAGFHGPQALRHPTDSVKQCKAVTTTTDSPTELILSWYTHSRDKQHDTDYTLSLKLWQNAGMRVWQRLNCGIKVWSSVVKYCCFQFVRWIFGWGKETMHVRHQNKTWPLAGIHIQWFKGFQLQERARGPLSPCQVWRGSDFTGRRAAKKRWVFVCLSVTHVNARDCTPDFAMKALEYRNDFDAVA